MSRNLALCLLSMSMACASVSVPFDPLAFLSTLTPTGEGTCRLTTGATVPCRVFEGGGSVYFALYHPKLGHLLAIQELRPDGTQSNVWALPNATVPAVATGTSA